MVSGQCYQDLILAVTAGRCCVSSRPRHIHSNGTHTQCEWVACTSSQSVYMAGNLHCLCTVRRTVHWCKQHGKLYSDTRCWWVRGVTGAIMDSSPKCATWATQFTHGLGSYACRSPWSHSLTFALQLCCASYMYPGYRIPTLNLKNDLAKTIFLRTCLSRSSDFTFSSLLLTYINAVWH